MYGSQIEQRTKELFQSKAECEKGLLSLLKAKDKLVEIDGSKVIVHQKADAEQIKVMQITLHSRCMQVEIPWLK